MSTAVAVKAPPCTRCGGWGYLPQHARVADGVCFKCGTRAATQDDPRKARQINGDEYMTGMRAVTVSEKSGELTKRQANVARARLRLSHGLWSANDELIVRNAEAHG